MRRQPVLAKRETIGAMLVAALALGASYGLGSPSARSDARPEPSPVSELRVSPNPCIAPKGRCAVEVAWTAALPGNQVAQLWIKSDSGEQRLVGCVPAGVSQRTKVDGIQVGHVSEFTLRSSASCASSSMPDQREISASVTAIPSLPRAPRSMIGLNSADLSRLYIGRAYEGDGSPIYRSLEQRIAEKAIADAGDLGDTFILVSMSGFYPITPQQVGTKHDDLQLWRDNPAEYWRTMDKMFDAFDRARIRIVPILDANTAQMPAANGETVRDLVVDRNSKSYRMLKEYTRQLIGRYRNRRTILFYEMSNELNLGVDLDAVGTCQRSSRAGAAACGAMGNFSTAELIGFTTNYTSYVRTLDPTRLISSGFALPRPSAEHLRHRPGWSAAGPDWTLDSVADLKRNLADISQGIDLISVHFYNEPSPNRQYGRRGNERFNIMGADNTDLLDIVKQIADEDGKRVFVGEFGDWYPFFKDDPNAPFSHNVIRKVLADRIPYAAVWVWEIGTSFNKIYGPVATYDNVEQGYTDKLIRSIVAANQSLGNRTNLGAGRDRTPPRVIVTWPLAGEQIATPNVEVYARASDDDLLHGIDRVEFLVDGKVQAAKRSPPFSANLESAAILTGNHVLAVKAYDSAGNSSVDYVRIREGRVERD